MLPEKNRLVVDTDKPMSSEFRILNKGLCVTNWTSNYHSQTRLSVHDNVLLENGWLPYLLFFLSLSPWCGMTSFWHSGVLRVGFWIMYSHLDPQKVVGCMGILPKKNPNFPFPFCIWLYVGIQDINFGLGLGIRLANKQVQNSDKMERQPIGCLESRSW